jgi:hydroxymethylpyrimidine/phosphomethylpyrimidine kinase
MHVNTVHRRRYLLGQKAAVNTRRTDGISAVMAAAVGAHRECVRLLVEAVSVAVTFILITQPNNTH